jgi:hypothetical protein
MLLFAILPLARLPGSAPVDCLGRTVEDAQTVHGLRISFAAAAFFFKK